MELQGKIINFLGDSITYGHSVEDPSKIFVSLVTRDLGLKEGRNYGVNGTRIADQPPGGHGDPEFSETFLKRARRMEKDADVVVVFGGTNDFGHGDAPLGAWGDTTIWTFYGACYCLMKELIEMYPTSRIVFMTPLHRTFEESLRGSGQKKQDAAPLIDYVQALRRTAEYFAIPLLDLYAMSGLQPNVPVLMEAYMPDGLHPNPAGHRRIADLLENFLKHL